MKVTIKTGAIKFSNVKPEYFDNVESQPQSKKVIELSIEPCEYQFECEPGELAEIYKEVLPGIKEIAKVFMDSRKK